MRGVLANGERLVALRKAKALTQEQLSQRADVDVKTIRVAEHGQPVDVATLKALATVLGVFLEEIVALEKRSDEDEKAKLRPVHQQLAAFKARDPDAFAATFTTDGVYHVNAHPNLPGSGIHRGRDEIRKGIRIAFETFVSEPIGIDKVEFSVVGHKVYMRLNNPKLKAVKTEMVREVSALFEFTIRDGLIAELRSHYHSGMLEELVFDKSANNQV